MKLDFEEKTELVALLSQAQQQVMKGDVARYQTIRVRLFQLLDRFQHEGGTVYANVT